MRAQPNKPADREKLRAQRQLMLECAVAFQLAHRFAKQVAKLLADHKCDRRGHEDDVCPLCEQDTAPFCSNCEVLGLLESVALQGPEKTIGLGEAAKFVEANTPGGLSCNRGHIARSLVNILDKLLAKEMQAFDDDQDADAEDDDDAPEVVAADDDQDAEEGGQD